MTKNHLVYITSIAFFIGIFTYAIYNNWLIFNFPLFQKGNTFTSTKATEKRNVLVFFPHEQEIKNEPRTILWHSEKADSCFHLVSEWLTVLDEEEVLKKKVSLEAISFTQNNQTVLISFNRLPFGHSESTNKKWIFIESLLKTISTAFPDLKSVSFLVHHQPAEDPHVDFSQPWPAHGFYAVNPQKKLSQPMQVANNPFTIMIDPEGDSQNTGRIINDAFERSITLQCAEELKQKLETILPGIRVILTRVPGEEIEPLQNATFSNRLKADLFIHLAFYHEQRAPSHASLFYFLYDPLSDFIAKNQPFDLIAYQAAHIQSLDTSIIFSSLMYETLQPLHQQGMFQLHMPKGLPVKPLIGIQAPALICEFGLTNKDAWRLFVPLLTEGIVHIVKWAQQKNVQPTQPAEPIGLGLPVIL